MLKRAKNGSGYGISCATVIYAGVCKVKLRGQLFLNFTWMTFSESKSMHLLVKKTIVWEDSYRRNFSLLSKIKPGLMTLPRELSKSYEAYIVSGFFN